MPTKPQDYLASAIKPRRERVLSYRDGFRFGVGFMVGLLLIVAVVCCLAWVAIAVLKLG